jgi:hypothetical protein
MERLRHEVAQMSDVMCIEISAEISLRLPRASLVTAACGAGRKAEGEP